MQRRASLLAATLVVCLGCTSRYVRPTTDERVEPTPARVQRGEYLVRVLGGCGVCHDGRTSGDVTDPALPTLALAGGNFLQDGDIGLYVPNLTPDEKTGLGTWTDDEVMRAIRDGIRKDGTVLFPLMPYGSYQYMSDEDVRAVVAYLRTVPARTPPHPPRKDEIPFIVRTAMGMGVTLHKPAREVPPPDRSDKVKYGEYVAHVGHCPECHDLGKTGPRARDDRFMGGSDRAFELAGVGKVWAPNLTPDEETGLGRYSAEEIKRALISGQRLDGKLMAPPMSLYVPNMALVAPEDMDALVAWLKSLPPVSHRVPPRQLTDKYRKLLRE